ncbi:hypothetical protein TNCV_4558871 [Trichonephila clavipes]|nr:hypothetical protein TNCV_4558871 [Trichonephila clavipes]
MVYVLPPPGFEKLIGDDKEFLDSKASLATQAGFRKHRSTVDQFVELTRVIKEPRTAIGNYDYYRSNPEASGESLLASA